jgi:hypothetical protein
MNLTSLKRLGLPFLQEVLRAFKRAFPSAPIEQTVKDLESLTPEITGLENEVLQEAFKGLSELKDLAKRSRSEISLDDASQRFTALNVYMPDKDLRNFDLLYLAAIIKMTLDFAASAADKPELQGWLTRRVGQDFKRLWLALVGMRMNPFSLVFPIEMANFNDQFSVLLSSLIGRRGIVRIEGGAGTGKTAFLRKACRSLLSHQIEQKPIVTTYLENKRGNAKQFVTDIYAGFFNRYLMETPNLREALTDTLPFVEEEDRAIWMAGHEEAIRESVFLPSHILESVFDSRKMKVNHIFNKIVSFTQVNELALVILLDDMDGKVRSGLSPTQINLLLSLQDECSPAFIIPSVRPRGKIARPIFDRSVGEVPVSGLSQADVQSMIQAFFSDPRSTFSNAIQVPNASGLISGLIGREQLQQLLFDDALKLILSESYIENRPAGSLFRPRSVVGICERILEEVASDALNIRATPREQDVFDAVKAFMRLNT